MQKDFKQEMAFLSRSNASPVTDVLLAEMDKKASLHPLRGREEDETEPLAVLPFLEADEERDTEVLCAERRVSLVYRFWQKTLDLLFALGSILLLALILPIVALFILLDSPGPVFYSQERVGYRGKKFRMYKFRSMYNNAEASGEAVWARQKDARVTRAGRFMRAFHLDELPQSLNILRGEMSLIGPRPEREAFVHDLAKHLPSYQQRLLVKPGLTGWAQVNYPYANSVEDSRKKLHYDLYYIKHQAILLDLLILLKTLKEVFLRHGT